MKVFSETADISTRFQLGDLEDTMDQSFSSVADASWLSDLSLLASTPLPHTSDDEDDITSPSILPLLSDSAPEPERER